MHSQVRNFKAVKLYHHFTGLKSNQILVYLYPYLFFLMNTNISWIQKFIFIFILYRYGYESDTESMDINIDINQIIKFYIIESKILLNG